MTRRHVPSTNGPWRSTSVAKAASARRCRGTWRTSPAARHRTGFRAHHRQRGSPSHRELLLSRLASRSLPLLCGVYLILTEYALPERRPSNIHGSCCRIGSYLRVALASSGMAEEDMGVTKIGTTDHDFAGLLAG